jgi:type I restriction enzyme S subunit
MELSLSFSHRDIGSIPEKWDVADLDTFVSVIDGDRGSEYPNGADFSESGYCLFLNAGNVTKDGFKFDECTFISEQKDALLNKGKLKRNDLVLTTRGTVGNVACFDAAARRCGLSVLPRMTDISAKGMAVSSLPLAEV